MKKKIRVVLPFLALLFIRPLDSHAQQPSNWSDKQLMEPEVLAAMLLSTKDAPVIISVGPGATIPNSINVGMVNKEEGLQKLRSQLEAIEKDKQLVIYCGCCPFEHCPNVRPAVEALRQMKFTNFYLLDLPHNIKKDWIDKGYPVSKP